MSVGNDHSELIVKSISSNLSSDISCEMLFHCPIFHPTLLLRASSIKTFAVRPYSDLPPGYPEDYDLWIRLLNHGCTFMSLNIPLYHYRSHSTQITSSYSRDLARHCLSLQSSYCNSRYGFYLSNNPINFID